MPSILQEVPQHQRYPQKSIVCVSLTYEISNETSILCLYSHTVGRSTYGASLLLNYYAVHIMKPCIRTYFDILSACCYNIVLT